MNKTILFEGVRLIDIKDYTIEDELFNEVELSESECAALANLIDNNPEELPLYELIDLNASEELKDKIMTYSYRGERFSFLPTKAYLEEV